MITVLRDVRSSYVDRVNRLEHCPICQASLRNQTKTPSAEGLNFCSPEHRMAWLVLLS